MITMKNKERSQKRKEIVLALRLFAVVVLYLPTMTYQPLTSYRLRNPKLPHPVSHANYLSMYLIQTTYKALSGEIHCHTPQYPPNEL